MLYLFGGSILGLLALGAILLGIVVVISAVQYWRNNNGKTKK